MITTRTQPAPRPGDPAWDVARLFPGQGCWTEEDFFALDSLTGGRVELSDGHIEVLPMPSVQHQLILQWIFKALDAFVAAGGLGMVFVSGTRVRLAEGRIREPDVVFISTANRHRVSRSLLDGADIAVEVVSEDEPQRDYSRKRTEYAQAGIGEYWIVDPRTDRITVLTLGQGPEYTVAGEYGPGQKAASLSLPGFELDVTNTFAAGNTTM